MIGRGTLVNALTVLLGATLGLLLGRRLPERVQETVRQALGAVTVLIGVQMGLLARDAQVVAALVSLVVGAVLGELLDLDGRLTRLAERLERRVAARGEGGRFVQGFLAASLLFCVGPMTVLGSIQDGLGQPPVLLYTKAALDGVAAVGLAAGLGVGVLWSALTVVVVQGGITAAVALTRAAAGQLPVAVMTAVGGAMVLTIGLQLLGAARVRTANLLPALVVAVLAELTLR